MLALLEDLRTERSWRLLVRAFIEELSNSLPGKVRQVIALPSPDDKIYDSNVLVVLEEDTPEGSLEVMRAASRAEESMKVGGIISPLVIGPEDEEAIERFKHEVQEG